MAPVPEGHSYGSIGRWPDIKGELGLGTGHISVDIPAICVTRAHLDSWYRQDDSESARFPGICRHITAWKHPEGFCYGKWCRPGLIGREALRTEAATNVSIPVKPPRSSEESRNPETVHLMCSPAALVRICLLPANQHLPQEKAGKTPYLLPRPLLHPSVHPRILLSIFP